MREHTLLVGCSCAKGGTGAYLVLAATAAV